MQVQRTALTPLETTIQLQRQLLDIMETLIKDMQEDIAERKYKNERKTR